MKYNVTVTGYIGAGLKQKAGDVVASFDTRKDLKQFAISNFRHFYNHTYIAKDQNGNIIPVLSSREMYNLNLSAQ